MGVVLAAGGARVASAWPGSGCHSRPLPRGGAEELGADPTLGADLDALLEDAVATRLTESAALVVVRRGKVLYRGAAGGARTHDLFDLASLTKVVATAPAVLQLVERGALRLDGVASVHLAQLLGAGDKQRITVRQLLLHTSGLHSVVWAGPLSDGRQQILGRLQRAPLKAAPGTAFRYSDIGYILLGELVAAAGKERLDAYAQRRLFEPLGMCQTGFAPPPAVRARLVNPWPGGDATKLGVVYDPLAARAGVTGHAGLYSTADDLARFGLALLQGGKLGAARVLAAKTVALATTGQALPGRPGQERGLGWGLGLAGSRGFSRRAYGHTGFTGTSLWIDPHHELAIVLLTNRTTYEDLPRRQAPSVSGLRRRVHDTILAALERRPARPVRSGLDVLVAGAFGQLRGRRVALLTNRTAVDARGRWIGDLLATEPARGALTLVALFVPEHGLAARVDRRVGDSTLTIAGRRVPVYSLFGGRRRPTTETLTGVDTLLVDLQTVGVRYYTYLATLGWAMEEAARRKLRVVVLDRPNPLGGAALQGPVSGAERRTSTNYHPLPVRYGLTLGEVARLYRGERRIAVELEVVRASGWRREQLFPETALPWVAPSPNIRSFRQALLYAGVGLLETTNVSVGRGTAGPFQLVGAPWLDGGALAAALNRRALPGVYFAPVRFTPTENPHRNVPCAGVRLVVTDAATLDPPVVGVALAVELRRRHAAQWETRNLFRLFGHPPTVAAILAGKELREITPLWHGALEQFRRLRRRYLLY